MHLRQVTGFARCLSPEAYLWAAALVLLAMTDPTGERLLRLCPLDLLEVAWCPGCGLGRSIGYFFRGDFSASFRTHLLGGGAVVILTGRIFTLVREAARHVPSPRNAP